MDFDYALGKLERDHSRLRKNNREKNVTSQRIKREAEVRRRQFEAKKLKDEQKKRKLEHVQDYMQRCEKMIGTNSEKETYILKVKEVEGDGDKIILPPSVLESFVSEDSFSSSSPLTFRVAVKNPDYSFPASEELRQMRDKFDLDEDCEDESDSTIPFLSELSHRYLSYTHASVLEFTAEEGDVGLPPCLMKRLSTSSSSCLELTRIHLRKGTACTLQPTRKAIQNGFYNLRDVKFVLEQSIVRTRATLTVKDTIQTWHRGVQFNLLVTSVTPHEFASISCIDTDINVDIAPVDDNEKSTEPLPDPKLTPQSLKNLPSTPFQEVREIPTTAELPLEPDIDQKHNVCQIQIRSRSNSSSRRFHLTQNTVSDLYYFASSLSNEKFNLVLTYPRKILYPDTRTLQEVGLSSGKQLLLMEPIV